MPDDETAKPLSAEEYAEWAAVTIEILKGRNAALVAALTEIADSNGYNWCRTVARNALDAHRKAIGE